jgi:hypothetical protein
VLGWSLRLHRPFFLLMHEQLFDHGRLSFGLLVHLMIFHFNSFLVQLLIFVNAFPDGMPCLEEVMIDDVGVRLLEMELLMFLWLVPV